MNAEIQQIVDDIGVEAALQILRRATPASSKRLTIVADDTMHKIPDSVLEGEVYVFSSGAIDVSSDASLESYLVDRLRALADKLKHDSWLKIRIVYSGHAVLAAQIKLLVYRITHLETEDVAYFGANGYRVVNIAMRGDIVS